MTLSKTPRYAEAERRIQACAREQSIELHLGNLGLTEVPEQVWQFEWLQVLRLHNNALSSIPDEIAGLTKLRSLVVRDNRISRISEAIGALTKLHDVHLGRNCLKELCDAFGSLVHLEELSLIDNAISDLPPSLARLEQLRVLFYAKNQLSDLPEQVFSLRSLRFLYLYENRLTSLPDLFRKLPNLVELDVARNRLDDLPSSFRHLHNLRLLNLAGNRFSTVPAQLRKLGSLQRLYLHGNTLDIPEEILGPQEYVDDVREVPSKDILRYYFVTAPLEKRPLNEAKLILVGRGGAGKTSLRKRLTTGEFDEQEDKTPGIAVVRWGLSLPDDSEVRLNVWDFGGQEIMHATHQFFLTKRSLYLVVLNAREGEQDANIEYWLKLLEAYGAGSPALVVVNKADQHPLDLDERGLREKFPFISGFAKTDCRNNLGIAELTQLIERETDALPDLRTPFPKTWFALKQELEAMPGDCITYDAYQALCAHSNEKDSGNQEVLIDFLNDLGSVLHFRDTHLFDLGVLKPEWVTQGIYGLLNADILKAANGVLSSNQLALLLDPVRYPRQRHRYLLALMQKFELCFEMPHTAGKEYLIAELLPKKTPELREWKRADVLRFEYHYNIFPEGLVPRFIVRTHTLSEGGERWRHGVELHQGEAWALVRADVQGKCIYIATRGPGRQPRDLLAVIRREFEEIHGGIKGLTADELVPVPDYPAVKLDYRKLLIREASGKTTVEFETETESLEMPLRKLLDNFEDISSRKERVQFIVQPGGILNYMTEEKFDFSHSRFTNSVVGAHMANVTNAIQQLSPERGDVRGALEELKKHAESLLKELPPEKQEEAVQNLDDFVKEAAKQTPRKPFLEVTSQGLIDAALTVAAISGPIIATVDKLRPLLGF